MKIWSGDVWSAGEVAMIDFRGFLYNWDLAGEVRPPRWLVQLSLLFLAGGVVALSSPWRDASGPARTLVGAALAAALLFQTKTLLVQPRTVLLALGDALGLAGLLSLLAPLVLPGSVEHAVLAAAGGLALLSTPLLGRLWSALLFSRELIADTITRARVVAAARSGTIDALVFEARERSGAWAYGTFCAESGGRPGRVTVSTLLTIAGVYFGEALELEGRAFLLREPVRGPAAPEHPEELLVTGAARVEYLGAHAAATDPAPFRAELRAATLALIAAHVAVASLVATALVALR